MYPARQHIQNVLQKYELLYKKRINFDILVPSERRRLWPFSDQEIPFRQNRYFNYITGAFDVTDAVVVYYHASKNLVLYLPEYDVEEAMWNGKPITPSEALKRFDVDDVKYINELRPAKGTKSVQSTEFNVVSYDNELKNAFDEARVFKDEFEIELIKKANTISARCHLECMSNALRANGERDIHAMFVYHSINQGSRFQSYDPICCAGPNSGTLHYVKNDEPFNSSWNMLLDAGAEYQCYTSDVTRCFPLSYPYWRTESRVIYDLVSSMQKTAFDMIKPGVQWKDVHFATHRTLIEGFRKLNIFKPEFKDQEIFDSDVSVAFYPHGVGHMLGMDTHDVGGHPMENEQQPKLKYLRIRRQLKPGMVVTVEPGIYFNQLMLDRFIGTESKFINYDVLEKYFPVGGIRIEDDIVITENGYTNLTEVTSDPDEILRRVNDGLTKPLF